MNETASQSSRNSLNLDESTHTIDIFQLNQQLDKLEEEADQEGVLFGSLNSWSLVDGMTKNEPDLNAFDNIVTLVQFRYYYYEIKI